MWCELKSFMLATGKEMLGNVLPVIDNYFSFQKGAVGVGEASPTEARCFLRLN